MNKRFSLSISILFHLILFVVFLFTDFKQEIKEEDETLKINLIKKSEVKRSVQKGSIISKADIAVSKVSDKVYEIDMPGKKSYLQEMAVDADQDSQVSDKLVHSKRKLSNIVDFEESLTGLTPKEKEIIKDNEKDNFSIRWDGEERKSTTNTSIDFSSFPTDSFTGVGVKAIFMVNKKGEVYGVEIAPPGSGSAEFDILVKQYVSKFTFSESDVVSRGEVFIVYNK